MKTRKIIEKIKDIFSHHCPKCNGRMELVDIEMDKMVYKCTKCGEKWF